MTANPNDISVQYLNDAVQLKIADRLKRAKDVFEQTFKQKPTFYVNVPGRWATEKWMSKVDVIITQFLGWIFSVNLIGEHVDYCGYPVLPMAIEQSILLAVAPSDDDLHITNVNEKYKPFTCSIDSIE